MNQNEQVEVDSQMEVPENMKEKRKRRRPRKPVIQNHHIRYASDPLGERKVRCYVGEHFILTQIQRRKRFSKGFLEALDEARPRMNLASVDLSNPTCLKGEN